MLPVVTEQTRQKIDELLQGDLTLWKKEMIHHLKEDNPEINSLLLEIAQNSQDPKQVILAGYLVYKALELAQEDEFQQAFSPYTL